MYVADSRFRTLKPHILRMRELILKQISYYVLIRTCLLKNYITLFKIKKYEKSMFFSLPVTTGSKGGRSDMQRELRVKTLYHL